MAYKASMRNAVPSTLEPEPRNSPYHGALRTTSRQACLLEADLHIHTALYSAQAELAPRSSDATEPRRLGTTVPDPEGHARILADRFGLQTALQLAEVYSAGGHEVYWSRVHVTLQHLHSIAA